LSWLKKFRSRVEDKIVLLVLLCAVLPMAALSFLAMREIESQTLRLAESQLRDLTKSYALDLLDKLDDAAQEMRYLNLGGTTEPGSAVVTGFQRLEISRNLERSELSRSRDSLQLLLQDKSHLLQGKVPFKRLLDELGHLPFGVRRCVSIDTVSVSCAGPEPQGDYLEAHWELPLSSMYETDFRLSVSSKQQMDAALDHVSLVSQILPPVILLVTATIAWMLIGFIRRRVAPLSELRSATRSIQKGDYTTRVNIDTGDEFEELGGAFNMMTSQMGRSSEKANALSEIDRLILSAAPLIEVIEYALLIAGRHYRSKCYVYLWREHPKQGELYEIKDGEVQSVELGLIPPPGIDRSDCGHMDALSVLLDERLVKSYAIRIDGSVSGELFTTRIDDRIDTTFSTLSELADRISVAATNSSRERALYRQANYDALTGLLNRQAFTDRLGQVIEAARRREIQGALLFLDLDRFKQVNDTEGHIVGDELLRTIAERLTDTLRASDIVARLGGDEFAVLVPEYASDAELTAVCRRVIDVTNAPISINRVWHQVDVSVGVSVFPRDGMDPGSLLTKADVAMYQAKSQAGSSFAYFDQSLNAITERRALVESQLRTALLDGHLKLHFQPKLELATMSVQGLEGLIRWESGSGIAYNPSDFIPIAEETGLIHQFTDLLVAESSRCLSLCRTENLGIERIAINISTRQFAKKGFAASFLAAVERNGLSPSQLEIEITESLFFADAAHVSEELARLRTAGVYIALDDFGTGYSSLNMLRALPLNSVKIDRSFIAPLMDSPEAQHFAQKIVEMAAALNLSVIAEGVEDWQEVALLEKLGCESIQGFVLSPAVPTDELVVLLKQYQAKGIQQEKVAAIPLVPR
jgi:diguanylate cyclase (GGDEF)-like protein